jgi:signal transduction histidine kinase
VTQLQQNSQSRAAKIRNVATLSRELRNRLEPIRSSLESLESSSDDDASGIEARCVIRRQFEQIIQLADNLIEVSDGESVDLSPDVAGGATSKPETSSAK